MQPIVGNSQRVLIELLKLTRTGSPARLPALVVNARSTPAVVKKTLTENGFCEDEISMSAHDRISLAMQLARQGSLTEVARTLKWQEFETFVTRCLSVAGYESRRNIRVKHAGRTLQIDVLGIKSGVVLCIDCKHWNTPAYPSRFNQAAEHQLLATREVLMQTHLPERRTWCSLPVILTLFDPRFKFHERGVVLVSVGQFADLLANLIPYTDDLPFIMAE